MGSTGVAFRPPPRLVDACHFYDRPDVDLLAEMVRDFVYDPASIGDDVRTIAEQRWAAVMDGENRLSYESMFEGDLQAHADALVVPDDSLAEVSVPVLLTHGRHDRYVPLDTSFHLVRALPRAQLHVFDRCGHWIQIERRAAFHRLVGEFLSARLD
jgi:2-hydroxymuconate-semialdehyde hydrolase